VKRELKRKNANGMWHTPRCRAQTIKINDVTASRFDWKLLDTQHEGESVCLRNKTVRSRLLRVIEEDSFETRLNRTSIKLVSFNLFVAFGVNFINILQAAFTHADLKSAKKNMT